MNKQLWKRLLTALFPFKIFISYRNLTLFVATLVLFSLVFGRQILETYWPKAKQVSNVLRDNQQNSLSARLLVNNLQWMHHSRPRTSKTTSKPCPRNSRYEDFRTMLIHWDKLAIQHNFHYVIAYGTLLGQYRGKTVIPWDQDVDILMNISLFRDLKRLSQKRGFRQGRDSKFRLVVQPEFELKAENDRGRWSCEGKKVPELMDSCSFVQPMGRLVYRSHHLDIFYFAVKDDLVQFDEALRPTNTSDMFPFVRCTFMKVLTWCPHKSKNVLKNMYRNIEPNHFCKDGEWIEV